MAKAIENFIDGDQMDHRLWNGDSPIMEAFRTDGYSDSSSASKEAKHDLPPTWSDVISPTLEETAEKSLMAKTAGNENTIISSAASSVDDELTDSKDKRDRDRVYARASYLIREGLAMQGWWVKHSVLRLH